MNSESAIIDVSTRFARLRDSIHAYENRAMKNLSAGQVVLLDSLAAHLGVASQTVALFAIISDLDPDGTLIPQITSASTKLTGQLDGLDALQTTIKNAIAFATSAATLAADVAAKDTDSIIDDLQNIKTLIP